MHINKAAITAPGGAMGVSGRRETSNYEPTASWDVYQASKKPRILIVEDDATLANLEAEILIAHDYAVATVLSGEQAILTLHQVIPDLVVLDLELTGEKQGWDVLQVLRTYAQMPVLITSSSKMTSRRHIKNSGETRSTLDHLPKPYAMQMLLKRVRRMLSIPPPE